MQPIRKDPAGFKTTELKAARVLVGLVNDFEELVLEYLNQNTGRSLAQLIKQPPASSYLHAADLFKAIDALEKHFDDYAEKPADTVVVAATLHGRAWADRNLARFGLTTAAPSYTNAKPYYLPVEQRMVDMYKERVKSEIKGLTSYQSTNVKRAITSGLQAGETINGITKRIREVTPMARNKAITIARTETLAAGNAAAKERYQLAGVEMVEWVAAYDDRVCPECESKHGNTYPIDEAPELPVHPNCRCTLVPLMKSEEE